MNVLYCGDMELGKIGGKDINEGEFVLSLMRHPRVKSLDVISFSRIDKPRGRVLNLSMTKNKYLSIFNIAIFLAKSSILNRPDIVFHRQTYFTPVIALWALIFRVKLHVKHFVPNVRMIKSAEHSLSPVKRTYAFLSNFLLCLAATKLDCATKKQVENSILRYPLFKRKFIHIENGVPISNYKHLDSARCKAEYDCSDHFVIGYVGALPYERGGKHLISIIPSLARKFQTLNKKFLIVIAGTGDDIEIKVNKIDAEYKKHIRYMGEVSYSDIPRLIKSFDILVALDDEKRLKYLGNAHQKIRQSLSAKVPVITSEFEIDSYLENGYVKNLKNINSESELEDAILKFVSFTPPSIDLSYVDIDEKVAQRINLYNTYI